MDADTSNPPFKERRQSLVDRRSRARQGKYDRRRNRCGRCRYFEAPDHCGWHDQPVTADTFACLHFALPDDEAPSDSGPETP